ncbi:TonB-dependent receptor [Idiomarina sp. ST20R2A10]|uniref:TonB-dependent receptor n=1 Tax=Idiomarina sp. ST20R2A10 TaxID=3418369 RepID=UPI003EC7ED86
MDQSQKDGLEIIKVQGEKRERSLSETTSSVAVTTAQKIDQENLLDLSDIISRTANVAETYGGSGFTIRGIRDENASANPLATIYVDGVAIPSQVNDAGPTDLWDIAQVEILRGSQSTVQGENSLAGAIIISTQDPTMDWTWKTRAIWSDPNDRRLAFAGGGPLIDDELAFRVAVEKRDFDGFTKNITRNEMEDSVDSLVTRLKLLWKPAGVKGLTAKLNFMRDDREDPYQYSYSRTDVENYYDNRVNLSNRENVTDITTDIVSLNLSYELNEHWSLASVTSQSDSDSLRLYDIDLIAEDNRYGEMDHNYKNQSQEIRLSFDYPDFHGLFGGYWSNREKDATDNQMAGVATPVAAIVGALQNMGLDEATATQFANSYSQELPLIPVDYDSDVSDRSTNRAVFADVEYALINNVALIAGFRYDTERYTYESLTETAFAGTLPDPDSYGEAGTAPNSIITGINQEVLNLVERAGNSVPESTRDFNAFLPKLAVRWDYDNNDSLALTVQRAYRSGGSSYNTARAEVFAYDPEYTTNYELAWRSRLLDNSLFVSSNLYYIDWEDKQVSANFGLNSFDSHTVNAGKAHLYGMELEARQYVNSYMDWYGSYSYSRTQYDQFEAIAGAQIRDFSGTEFIFAPKHTAALGVNLYPARDWTVNVNANYRDSVLSDAGARDNRASSRTLFNAKISYDKFDWSAYIFANNIFDKGYIEYYRTDMPYAIFGAPRVVGVGFEAEF